jgi:hypothetical protein
MHRIKYSLLLLIITVFGFSCAELQKVLETGGNQPLSSAEIARGLKEALDIGISKGSDILSARDGYFRSPYKILLPEEARVITQRLSVIPGFTQVEDILVERLNRAAEDAATKAKPIFQQAIRQMTFQDAMGILMGPEDAATAYLNRVTYNELYEAFNPIILESLNKFNAVSYWEDAVNAYNRIPFINQANPRLDDYVTTKALDGLFDMVKKEEIGIRKDVSLRTTELLRRVFARQDSNWQG